MEIKKRKRRSKVATGANEALYINKFKEKIAQSKNFQECLISLQTIIAEPKLIGLLEMAFKRSLWFANSAKSLKELLDLAKQEDYSYFIDLINQKVSQMRIVIE